MICLHIWKFIIHLVGRGGESMDIEKTYLKMNTPEKREMFETILMKDVAIFNMMMSSLDDAHQVAHVGMNGMVIQLTVHPMSNVEGENNWCDKCEKDIYPEIPETNNFCDCVRN